MQDLADAHSKNKDKQISIEGYTDPRFAGLPPLLLKAISESGYQKKLYELGTKHKLAIDTMAGLEDLTIQFMKGEIEPAQYEKELVASLGIKPDASKEIANDINTTILLPIRELMKKEEQKAVTTPDIPFPPYRPTINATLPKTQSGILATAGIEMIHDDYTQNDRSVPTTKNEDGVLTQAGISVIDEKRSLNEEHILPSPSNRNRALEGIEHPAKTMTSIHEEKLQKTTTSTPQTSDYSLPKIGGGDIYREPIG